MSILSKAAKLWRTSKSSSSSALRGLSTITNTTKMDTQLPKNVVVVGGVAGGMSFATRFRRLSETSRITVLEAGPYPSFANCGIPYALSGIIADESKLHVQTVPKLESWFDLDVRVNTTVTAIDRKAKTVTVKPSTAGSDEASVTTLPYDKLVLAQGAEPFVPPSIEGADLPHVFTLTTIPDLQGIQSHVATTKAKKAAVIGAGFIGIEAAENLAQLGMEVTLYEFLPHVLPPLDQDLAEPLHAEMRRNGVKLALGARVRRISAPVDGRRGLVEADNAPDAEADLVIMAAGVRARTQLAKSAGLQVGRTGVVVDATMKTSDPDVYAVGDMVETLDMVTGETAQLALAGPASRQGRLAADHMCGVLTHSGGTKEQQTPVAYRGNVGTSVCKVFTETAGMVGPSTETLARKKIPHQYVTVHPSDHAGYYPGSAPMTIKLAFAPDTGLILGAQLVGRRNVDKRIDVLATAIRAGMTVEDLEHLELAYSPPYGSAKDPVNMAGFAAGNVLKGLVRIVHAADFGQQDGKEKLEDWAVVDVRSEGEFSNGHVKGAVNLPIATLRQNLEQLDAFNAAGKKVLVYCWVGYRGYLAYRVLKQRGYDVWNLDGGFKAVSEGGYNGLVA